MEFKLQIEPSYLIRCLLKVLILLFDVIKLRLGQRMKGVCATSGISPEFRHTKAETTGPFYA